MFNKFFELLALSFFGLSAAQGGIVEIGNLFEYHPTGTTACGETGSDSGLWIGVGQTFLDEFGCGHPVRIIAFNGTQTTVVPIGDVCPDTVCQATDDIEAPPAVFSALGASGSTVLVDVRWEP